MASDWSKLEPHYKSLLLRDDGDAVERLGVQEHGLDTTFSHYQDFWRFHVAPATQRPRGPLNFNAGVQSEVIDVVQRSYTVFAYLVEAHEYLRDVKNGLPGPRLRNWQNTILYAGNSLQVFRELRIAIEAATRAAGAPITVFSTTHWDASWKPRYDSIINYRNYVTHQGRCQFFSVADDYYVLNRSEVPAHGSLGWSSWIHSDDDFKANRSRFSTIIDVASETVAETTTWLNDAYQHINRLLRTYPSMPSYQGLWGWNETEYQNPFLIAGPPKPIPMPSTDAALIAGGESGVRRVSVSISGVTAPPTSSRPTTF